MLSTKDVFVLPLQGNLQVLSIHGGSTEPVDAKKIGLTQDNKGIFAHQFQVLLELDVENSDFIFHQGTMCTITSFRATLTHYVGNSIRKLYYIISSLFVYLFIYVNTEDLMEEWLLHKFMFVLNVVILNK